MVYLEGSCGSQRLLCARAASPDVFQEVTEAFTPPPPPASVSASRALPSEPGDREGGGSPSGPRSCCLASRPARLGLTFVGSQLPLIHRDEVQVVQVVLVAVVRGRGVGAVGHVGGPEAVRPQLLRVPGGGWPLISVKSPKCVCSPPGPEPSTDQSHWLENGQGAVPDLPGTHSALPSICPFLTQLQHKQRCKARAGVSARGCPSLEGQDRTGQTPRPLGSRMQKKARKDDPFFLLP